MTLKRAARGQRPMANKRGWCGSARRSARVRKTRPESILTSGVTFSKYDRKKKRFSHKEFCQHIRDNFLSRLEKRLARYDVLCRGLLLSRSGIDFIVGPVEQPISSRGVLFVPKGWRGTGTVSQYEHDLSEVVRHAYPTRLVRGFVDFMSRLCTGKCVTCGNHASYGLFFGCAHFMEKQRSRISEYVRDYLLILAESNQDDEEVLEYVRKQLSSAFSADERLEEALRAYWWSWIWWPLWSQVGHLVREAQLTWDLARLGIAGIGYGALPPISKKRVEKTVTRTRTVLSFTGWLLAHAELNWETIDGIRLPVVDELFHRRVDLMRKIYMTSRAQVIGRILSYVASGHDMPVKSTLFRGGVIFPFHLAAADDSIIYGDWSRGESNACSTLASWLMRAWATGEKGWIPTIPFLRSVRVAAGLTADTNLTFVKAHTRETHSDLRVIGVVSLVKRNHLEALEVLEVGSAFRVTAPEKVGTFGLGFVTLKPWDKPRRCDGFESSNWSVELAAIAREIESKRRELQVQITASGYEEDWEPNYLRARPQRPLVPNVHWESDYEVNYERGAPVDERPIRAFWDAMAVWHREGKPFELMRNLKSVEKSARILRYLTASAFE